MLSGLVPDVVDDAHADRLGKRWRQGHSGGTDAGDEEATVRAGGEGIDVPPEGVDEFLTGGDVPGRLAGAVFELPVLVGLAGIGPRAAGVLGGAEQQQLAPPLVGQGAVVDAQVACFGGARAGVVEAGEEGFEGGVGPRTAVSSARACLGWTTTRRSTASSVGGRRHLVSFMGFVSRSCRSTA